MRELRRVQTEKIHFYKEREIRLTPGIPTELNARTH